MIIVNGTNDEIMSIENFLTDTLGSYSIRASSWAEDVAALKEFGINARWSPGSLRIELHFPTEHEEMIFRLKYL